MYSQRDHDGLGSQHTAGARPSPKSSPDIHSLVISTTHLLGSTLRHIGIITVPQDDDQGLRVSISLEKCCEQRQWQTNRASIIYLINLDEIDAGRRCNYRPWPRVLDCETGRRKFLCCYLYQACMTSIFSWHNCVNPIFFENSKAPIVAFLAKDATSTWHVHGLVRGTQPVLPTPRSSPDSQKYKNFTASLFPPPSPLLLDFPRRL